MDPVIEIKMPEEKVIEETTAIDQALEILEVATVIADKLDDAADDDDGVIRVLDRLTSIETSLAALLVRIESLIDLAQTPAPVIVEVPDVVEEEEPIIENVEVSGGGDVQIEVEPEEVEKVVAPEIRKKKQRKWL